ncbi:hypothetical protein [Alicyclobacillus acidiphilus]|uniref:hypothetical protein n=1 Tax=Alicyclobacillus acidiphilus TaxID=182455 RepID=UPI000AE49A95|nr:hypothetical protein [Alicyclobacillus acidiphilus]
MNEVNGAHFRQEMERIRRETHSSPNAAARPNDGADRELAVTLLHEMADRVGESDPELYTKVNTSPDPELVVGFTNSRFYSPRLSVRVKPSSRGVKVTVSDGKWKQSPSQNGLWADWADEKDVFDGSFDKGLIRSAIEGAVLEWYRYCKENGQSGLPPH